MLGSLALAQPAWQKLESREGKFQVLMPGVARSSVVPLQTSVGNLKQFQFLVNLGERAFMVTYVDYPQDTVDELGPEKILQNVLAGIASAGSKILEDKPLELGESLGRELLYLKPNGFLIHSRVVLVGNRFYQLTLVRSGQEPDPDAARFFESFRFSP